MRLNKLEMLRRELNEACKEVAKLSGVGSERVLELSEKLDKEVYIEQMRRFRENKSVCR